MFHTFRFVVWSLFLHDGMMRWADWQIRKPGGGPTMGTYQTRGTKQAWGQHPCYRSCMGVVLRIRVLKKPESSQRGFSPMRPRPDPRRMLARLNIPLKKSQNIESTNPTGFGRIVSRIAEAHAQDQAPCSTASLHACLEQARHWNQERHGAQEPQCALTKRDRATCLR